uniref:NADP-dependent oxidoreductase domain-containing protein n=1 Tax=Acrobeloides nanus TaxID=290746 RepID=A0A914CNJ4_9BILA
MASKIPTLKMHNGLETPIIGLGTATDIQNPNVEELNKAFDAALDAGYRLFDTAALYNNEAIIGDFFEEKFKQGNLKRSDIFITTKLWISEFQPENAEKAIKASLERLRTNYIDLYLLHGPTPVKIENGQTVPDLVPHIETWRVLEKYYKNGTFKSIGLSNFTIPQIQDLIKQAEIKPHNLQILLRQMTQRGIIIIPRSTNPKRIHENINIFNFTLTDNELKKFLEIKENTRNFLWDNVEGHPWHFVDSLRGKN